MTGPGAATTYLMDNEAPDESTRLGLLQTWADPFSVRVLDKVGVAAGWSCVDVGAGLGSIARWLARRSGSTGSTLATDVNPALLDDLATDDVAVRRADITHEPLTQATYDLVHARMVLEHLPTRSQVVRDCGNALKPGGWLVLEALDAGGVGADPATGRASVRFDEYSRRLLAMLRSVGMEACYGRALCGELSAAGLQICGVDGLAPVARGGSPLAQFWAATWTLLAPAIVGAGVLDAEQLAEYVALHADPRFSWLAPSLIAAWARRAT
jgi:SAM-dependent methyltransferase